MRPAGCNWIGFLPSADFEKKKKKADRTNASTSGDSAASITK